MISAKDKIKKAIFRIVSIKPFQQVTTEEIIAEAEVAKASFYYYFKDKYEALIEVFKDKILSPISKIKDGSIDKKWSERVLGISLKMMKHKDFLTNCMKIDNLISFYLSVTRYYYRQLTSYLKEQKANVESVAIKKASQNMAQTDMLVVYQYALGKIDDTGLKMLREAWPQTVPVVLEKYTI